MDLRIRDICREKGIAQKKLANMINMSAIGLSKAINGNPTKDTLEKIASALGVAITELFERPKENTITCPKCGTQLDVRVKE